MAGRNRAWRRPACLLLAAALFFAPLTGAAAEMRIIDFENGTPQGFGPRGGDGRDTSVLTVTGEEAHGGTKSLLVTGRSAGWNGPSLNVTFYTEPGMSYTVSAWVLPKAPEQSSFSLSTQVGEGDGASYFRLDRQSISKAGGWTELRGSFVYPESEYITIYVENDTPDAEFYIDDISFFAASGGGILAGIQLPSLHEAYKDYFLLGTAVLSSDLSGTRFELVKRHFNALTAGNSMKPNALGGKTRGDYTFTSADRMLELIEAEGIPVHGHTLVWHQQSAAWLNTNPDGSVLTRAEAKANLEEYISAVAGHYAGRVISWDVVNEAFQSGVSDVPIDWRSALRRGGNGNEAAPWYGAYANGADTADGESGADYIYDAFVFARLADPNAILYFNDFNETDRGKREAIARMTEELNEKWTGDPRNAEPGRLLIEGLGLQAHYWTDNLNPQDVEDTIVRWAKTGAEICVSELDIPAGNFSRYKTLDEAEERKQAELYAKLFRIFRQYSECIARVTIWGIDDPTSWRSGGSPLLFDENGGPKLSFYAALDPEGYLAGDYDGVKNQTGGESTGVPVSPPPAGPSSAEPSPAEGTPSPPDAPVAEDDGGGFPAWLLVTGLAAIAASCAAIVSLRRKKQ
ncbi:MAG: endo-1,4-beta-xylanase [Oscillospiraceae bacterium]|jgi:endo-1,4-beta-xylanase|nr:endo-1,4-beta-xylanase [Oscillospiraceae bacterium]